MPDQGERQTSSPLEILQSHLALRAADRLEDDLRENFAEDVTIIDRHRSYSGHDGARDSARLLAESIGEAGFEYERVVVHGRMGYVVWSVRDGEVSARGVDSFLIEDGKIRGQTIYYRTTDDSSEVPF